jgi:hypothetical protein
MSLSSDNLFSSCLKVVWLFGRTITFIISRYWSAKVMIDINLFVLYLIVA